MAKKVLIIGATGKIGKMLAEEMKKSSNMIPVALFRNENQKEFFEKLNIEFTIRNLEDSIDKLSSAMENVDAVVFTAGSGANTGPDKTLTVDLDGAVKSMEAAQKANVSRFVIVSALGAGDRSSWNNRSIKPYYVAKHYADRILQSIGLDYTIIRPGRLLDRAGSGKITNTDPASKEGVPREDVASLIIESLRNDNTVDKIIEFNEGETSIEKVAANI